MIFGSREGRILVEGGKEGERGRRMCVLGLLSFCHCLFLDRTPPEARRQESPVNGVSTGSTSCGPKRGLGRGEQRLAHSQGNGHKGKHILNNFVHVK